MMYEHSVSWDTPDVTQILCSGMQEVYVCDGTYCYHVSYLHLQRKQTAYSRIICGFRDVGLWFHWLWMLSGLRAVWVWPGTICHSLFPPDCLIPGWKVLLWRHLLAATLITFLLFRSLLLSVRLNGDHMETFAYVSCFSGISFDKKRQRYHKCLYYSFRRDLNNVSNWFQICKIESYYY